MRGEIVVKRLPVAAAAVIAVLLAFAMGVAQADPRDHGRPREHSRGGHDHLDARFSHNRYYPSRGFAVHDLPRDRIVVNGPRGRYFYSGGVWYSGRGSSFVVVGAPIGFFVPVLPPYYTTVWVGGAPYYYANDSYYVWRDSDQQYEVVTPPDEQAASTEAPPPPPSVNDDVFVYPKNDQSEDVQARDKYECHKWAQGESGFDPTQPNGGVSPGESGTKRAAYQRAIGACLEGRGYSVK